MYACGAYAGCSGMYGMHAPDWCQGTAYVMYVVARGYVCMQVACGRVSGQGKASGRKDEVWASRMSGLKGKGRAEEAGLGGVSMHIYMSRV